MKISFMGEKCKKKETEIMKKNGMERMIGKGKKKKKKKKKNRRSPNTLELKSCTKPTNPIPLHIYFFSEASNPT